MKCCIVQPPFVQLNAPYPAAWYLESWLKAHAQTATVQDHSIETIRHIYSRRGIAKIFEDAERISQTRPFKGSESELSHYSRFMSSAPEYIAWIDDTIAYLSGTNPSFAHRITSSSSIPVGARVESILESDFPPATQDLATLLATAIVEDLGDFISRILDPGFSLIRYADRLASGQASFNSLEAMPGKSYILKTFYAPIIDSCIRKNPEADIYLVTIPFPGCLVPALFLASELKRLTSQETRIIFGGGYVSTELRELKNPGIFKYCDALCFDSGYSALAGLLEALERSGLKVWPPRGLDTVSGLMYLTEEGEIIKSGLRENSIYWMEERGSPHKVRHLDPAPLRSTFPDYSMVDFSKYLRMGDSTNPMHRLWSDSPWLKYQLACGCYWARCSFCDTTLEYVADYVPVDIEALVAACSRSAAATGIHGIHFVDEAMPMAKLLSFAIQNRKRSQNGERPFHFWGNVRFDASWTAERCQLLASSGLIAVSGGIEVASEKGLAMTDKGFDLAGLVRCLLSLKEAGILVHAYLIYGFPGQDEAAILESAEIVRQLFEEGLVDSAFWHRFVLTRHSRMYAEWEKGLYPDLVPKPVTSDFASNDIPFAGSSRFDRYDEPLTRSLAAWMAGEGIAKPIGSWFSRMDAKTLQRLPKSTTIKRLMETAGRASAAHLDTLPAENSRAFWLAGAPVLTGSENHKALSRVRQGTVISTELPQELAHKLVSIVRNLASKAEGMPAQEFLSEAFPGESIRYLPEFRGEGLVFI